jgi:transcriptional regulator GlxA family with amidase domain
MSRLRPPAVPRSALPVVLVAFPGGSGLDLTGPYEVFARANRDLREAGRRHPGYEIRVVASAPGPLAASSGLRVCVDASIAEFRGPIDTLVVTGGRGVFRACEDAALVAWLRRRARRARRYGSVCTGAFLLARAGLLDGRRVTTHWNSAAALAERYPALDVEPDAIYIRDANVFTSAGITAAIDLALALVEEDLGADIALSVARQLVVYLRRSGGQSQYSAPLRLSSAQAPAVRDLVTFAVEHPAADLSVQALAQRLGLSPRQLSRVFRRETGHSPAEVVEKIRVETAQRAITVSRAGLEAVAAQAGFGSAEIMRRVFLRLLGTTPSDYRARFGALEVAQ